ncbi:MAG: type II toxin-antitoxin system RelE/ParE family toxin [Amaricoccus sp.]
MTPKPLRLRPAARADSRRIAAYYAAEAGEPVAQSFLAALQRAFDHLRAYPASGSLRFEPDTGLPGLRVWPVRRFPHLLLYFDRADHVDVARILHGSRDIPKLLRRTALSR